MSRQVVAVAVVLVLAGASTQAAHADVYTWVDAAGNLNVSNLAPPAGTRVKSVAREDPAAKLRAEAIRDAAKDTELRALTQRVAELERANEPEPWPGRAPYTVPPPYGAPMAYGGPMPYGGPPAPAPAPRFSLTMMPSTPEETTSSLSPWCGSLDCVPMLGSPFYAPSVIVIPATHYHHHHGRATRRPAPPAMAPAARGPRRG